MRAASAPLCGHARRRHRPGRFSRRCPAGGPGPRPCQNLSRIEEFRAEPGAEGDRSRHSQRLRIRVARTQRSGQIDPDQYPGRPGQQDRRDGLDLGDRYRQAAAPVARRHRRGAAGTEYRRFLHAARTAQLSGRPVRRAEARPDYRRIARGRPAGRQGGKLFAHAFRRHAAAAHGRQGDGSQAAGSGAGRTDRRRGCRIAPAIVGPHPDAEPVGDDHPADDPLSGRGAGTVRPDRLHQPWRGHRLRHDRGIAEADGPQGSDHPPG